MRPANRWKAVLATLAILLLIGGCGGEDADPEASETGGATTGPTAAADATTPTEAGTASPAEAGSASAEPSAGGTGGAYVVQSGDTLTSIAEEFGTTVEAIVEANNLEDPDVLAIGQELVIPTDG